MSELTDLDLVLNRDWRDLTAVDDHMEGFTVVAIVEIEAIPEEPTLWGYKVGDRVRYSHPHDDALLGVRVVGAIESEPTRLRLDVPGGVEGVGRVHSPDRIRLAV